jgi:TfoX/Sxy family transcriptional regulator of competence genes
VVEREFILNSANVTGEVSDGQIRSLNMTAEESLSVAVRDHRSRAGVMSEVKMFGGTGFMLNRNLVAAVSKRGLLLRVGKDRYRDALAWPGARPM